MLGWRVTTSKTTPLVLSVLAQALATRRRGDATFTSAGLVHHSDADRQHTSLALSEALLEAGIAGSIGSVGDALDNALVGSTIGLYKSELVDRHHKAWTGRAELERETAAWISWCNHRRLHSATGYRPSTEHEQHCRERTTTDCLDPEAANRSLLRTQGDSRSNVLRLPARTNLAVRPELTS